MFGFDTLRWAQQLTLLPPGPPQIVYEAHLRAVMIDRAGMSRGATEMTLQALVRTEI